MRFILWIDTQLPLTEAGQRIVGVVTDLQVRLLHAIKNKLHWLWHFIDYTGSSIDCSNIEATFIYLDRTKEYCLSAASMRHLL